MNAIIYLNYENRNSETLSYNIETVGKNMNYIKFIIDFTFRH